MKSWNLVPLPRTHIRNIDFLAPLSLQAKVNPKLEICHAVASGSMSSSKAKDLPSSSKNLAFSRSRTRKDALHVAFNDNPPTNLNLADIDFTTAPELMEDIVNFGFEDVVISTRVCVHKMPPNFDHLPEFAEVDTFYEKQIRSSYKTHQARRMFGTYVWNPYPTIKSKLYISRVIESMSDPVLRRMKSGLVTSWLKPTDTKLGTGHFGTRAHYLLEELNKSPDDWWLDTGEPKTMDSRFDSIDFNLRLFLLKKYHLEPMAFAVEF